MGQARKEIDKKRRGKLAIDGALAGIGMKAIMEAVAPESGDSPMNFPALQDTLADEMWDRLDKYVSQFFVQHGGTDTRCNCGRGGDEPEDLQAHRTTGMLNLLRFVIKGDEDDD